MTISTQRRGRPRDTDKAAAILNVAWALFLEQGVGATSIEAIAARAGVSKMTVYKHFDGKHALFEQAVRRRMSDIEAAQAAALPAGAGLTLEQRLRAFGIGIMAFLATREAVDFYSVLAGELRRHPALARVFYEAGPRRTIANLAAILADTGDRVAIDDPTRAAEALFGLWQGASNFQLALDVDGPMPIHLVADRVDHGLALFLRAYGRHD